MTADEIVAELRGYGSESIKRVLLKHGAREPFFGVKVEDLKKIQKRVKKDHQLALDLYETGISDAMYLAGLIADDEKMTKQDLEHWVKGAYWYMLSQYVVPGVAAGGKYGHELALKWIESKRENTAIAGWATLSALVSIKDNDELDIEELAELLARVEQTIHAAPNYVRYVMNGYVIAVGCYVPGLTKAALAAAKRIGKVQVDMGETACKVPSAAEYIKKVVDRGTIGKKRKSAKC